MELNVTDLGKLRDQVLEKRALQQQAKADSEKAIKSLEPMIEKLISLYGDKLIAMGVDIGIITSLDYTKLQNDNNYLNEVKSKVSEISISLQKEIEVLLDVQS